MSTLTLALLAVLSPVAQDEKKNDGDPLRGDAAQALRLTAKAGAVQVAGRLKTEVREDQTEEEPTECEVSGAAGGSPFAAALKARGDHTAAEIFYKGGKLAGRTLWRSVPLDLGKSPSELLSLVNLERLAVYAEKATKTEAGAGGTVGTAECRSIRLELPPDTVRGHSEDNDATEEDEKGLSSVEAELWIEKASGRAVRIEAKVHRLYKDDPKPGSTTKSVSSYALTFEKAGEAKVSIPKEIERLLKD
jgi:hypothetical protein